MKHVINTTDKKGNPLVIKISLNDECKNGHQDFSITGTLGTKGKPLTDRYIKTCGYIHEEILKAKPSLKIFVDLHLCDYLGNPMHATAKGFYHLSRMSKEKFINYYNITENQYNVLLSSNNEVQFYLGLVSSGVIDNWKEKADKAIKLLESMTGEKFINTSTRTQLIKPTEEQIKDNEEKVKNNYYSEEEINKRELQKIEDFKNSLIHEVEEKMKNNKLELNTKLEVLKVGGIKAVKNSIYYNHSKEIKFNWSSTSNELTEDEINHLKENLNLPKGVTIKN